MMKCKKCGATLLMEQIPEVHISEAEVDCNQPNCDGKATYVNNNLNSSAPTTTRILREDNKDG